MKSQKLTKVIVFLCITFGVVFWSAVAAYVVAPKGDQIPALTVQAPTEQDPDLLAKAADLGIDVSNITLRYGETSAEKRMAEYTYTEYDDESVSYKIVVRPNPSTNEVYASFAHEYYHYYWDTHKEVRSVAPLVRVLYTSYPALYDRMATYRNQGMVDASEDFANELYAIICTEVNSSAISADLQTYCSNGVPNRSMITSIY